MLDRTGSMCLDRRNRADCGDLNNAKEGVHTLLSILNPPYAQVGMIAFPPLDGAGTRRLQLAAGDEQRLHRLRQHRQAAT